MYKKGQLKYNDAGTLLAVLRPSGRDANSARGTLGGDACAPPRPTPRVFYFQKISCIITCENRFWCQTFHHFFVWLFCFRPNSVYPAISVFLNVFGFLSDNLPNLYANLEGCSAHCCVTCWHVCLRKFCTIQYVSHHIFVIREGGWVCFMIFPSAQTGFCAKAPFRPRVGRQLKHEPKVLHGACVCKLCADAHSSLSVRLATGMPSFTLLIFVLIVPIVPEIAFLAMYLQIKKQNHSFRFVSWSFHAENNGWSYKNHIC